jgi:two-component system NtrC family response regulator
MHLPRNVRLIFIQSSIDEKRKASPEPPHGAPPQDDDGFSIPVRFTDPPPTLKQLRDQVTEQLESIYLRRLMSHTQKDLDRVGQLSGLSKPRIYALLKKYDIPKS